MDREPSNYSDEPSHRPELKAPPDINPGHVFVDDDGVRPIWRVLIYAAGYYILRIVLLSVAGAVLSNQSQAVGPLRLQLLEQSLLLVAALAPAWLLSRLELRSFASYGLPWQGAFGRHFWAGVGWGLVALTLLLLALRIPGDFDFGKLAIHGSRIFKLAVFWSVLFLLVGLYEDFLFRGYSLATLSNSVGFWPAAVLLSAVFGALHFPQEYALGDAWGAYAGALGAACIGLFFCLTLRRTGTLWFAIGMHTSWDWGESFLYSVPDSGTRVPGHLLKSSLHGQNWLTGGPVGPEASVLLFALIALMWVLFDRIYPARRNATPLTTSYQE